MHGTVTTGESKAAQFVPAIADLAAAELGFTPFAGTLNLAAAEPVDALPERVVEDDSLGMDNCRGVAFRPCSVGGVRAAVVRPLVDGYPDAKTEVVAPVELRSLFQLADGDPLSLAPSDDLSAPDGPRARGSALDEFDAVVFDLDRTLVDLPVDWRAVKADLASLLGDHLAEPIHEGMDADLRAVARDHGLWDEYVELLAGYEVDGAARSEPLPLLRALPELGCPVAVCTKNAERAAEVALERHGALGAVDAVVARETVVEQKPHPAPLRRCLADLQTPAGDALFVGDELTDMEAASRAGTSYLPPDRIDVDA